jgi:copper chaperone CopZ
MDRLTMQISGMGCGHCVAAVTGALAELDGVEVERVAVGSATVAFDPRAVAPEAITRAVEAAGDAARPVAA